MKLQLGAICAVIFLLMPPTRGHDLKQALFFSFFLEFLMPPTRGHDLKLSGGKNVMICNGMPPTRGHDLKPKEENHTERLVFRMPPTRGHDLKHLND